MDIVRERLEREFDLSLIATAPSVEYMAQLTDGSEVRVHSPAEMPSPQKIEVIEEPFLQATMLLPSENTGTVMELCQARRGEMLRMEYLSPERVELVYRIPLAEVVMDFFDALKSRTKGYASLDYEPAGFSAGRARQDRHHAQRLARRRLQRHHPPLRHEGVRAEDDRETA